MLLAFQPLNVFDLCTKILIFFPFCFHGVLLLLFFFLIFIIIVFFFFFSGCLEIQFDLPNCYAKRPSWVAGIPYHMLYYSLI